MRYSRLTQIILARHFGFLRAERIALSRAKIVNANRRCYRPDWIALNVGIHSNPVAIIAGIACAFTRSRTVESLRDRSRPHDTASTGAAGAATRARSRAESVAGAVSVSTRDRESAKELEGEDFGGTMSAAETFRASSGMRG